MRKSIFFASIFIIAGLLINFNVLAQENTDDITAEDLGVSEPKTLPDSPLYFFKDLWREVRTAFTFGAVNRAELQLRWANEKLIEAKKLAEKTGKEEIAGKAVERYQKEMEKIRNRVEKFKEKAQDNPKIDVFLDRFADKALKQQVLIEKLEERLSHNPEAIEKIKAAKERVLENHSQIIERLEEKDKVKERLEKNIQEIKKIKALPIIRKIEENKEKIQEKVKEIKERCKDLCGDGTCQQVVCMAIGCPCSETERTCPQDCKKDECGDLCPCWKLRGDQCAEYNTFEICGVDCGETCGVYQSKERCEQREYDKILPQNIWMPNERK